MKLFYKAILILCVFCTGLFLLFSCHEDWSEWIEVSMDVDGTALQDTVIPYQGERKTFFIKTNSVWKVNAPSWMAFDKLSGTGDDAVEVTIAANGTTGIRTGTIEITAGEIPASTDIAGKKVKQISFSQRASYESVTLEITSCSMTRKAVYNSTDYEYSGEIKYIVSSSLPDAEFTELIKGAAIGLDFVGYYTGKYPINEGTVAYWSDHDSFGLKTGKVAVTSGEHILNYDRKIPDVYGVFTRIVLRPSLYLNKGYKEIKGKNFECIISTK